VSLAILLPLFRPGFVLTYDLSFVPNPRLSLHLLGLGRDLPRDVPFGLLVALASRAVGGAVLERLVLLAVFGLSAWGAARLVPAGRWGSAAAGVLYACNPYTYERILLGQAALLLGYAALPWVAASALHLRRDPRAVLGLAMGLSLASFSSPYGGLIASAVALGVAGCPPARGGERPGRALALVAGLAVILNAPWIVPWVLHPGGVASPAPAFELFRARADSPLGVAGSLLSLGGLWRSDLAPPARDTLAWLPAFVLIAVLAVVGLRMTARRWPHGALTGLAIVAVIGLILALGVAIPVLGGGIRWIGVHVPGGGALRDGQKFVAPFALLLAMGFGTGVDAMMERSPGPRAAAAVGVALVAVGAALAPTLAWGASGRLFASSYPPAWERARAVMASDPSPGGVLVLPWHLYLPFSWNRDRPVLQPARAAFTRDALVADALEVGRSVVPPEDPWSARADPVMRDGRGSFAPDLPRLGVRYVIVFKEADWRIQASPGRLSGLTRMLDEPDLALYRSDVPTRVPTFPGPPMTPVVIADAVALGAFGAALAGLIIEWRRRPRTGRPDARLVS
jgi:hypothetical protein